MKIYLTLFILISCLLSGCDDTSVNYNTSESSQTAGEQTKKQAVFLEQTELEDQAIKVSPQKKQKVSPKINTKIPPANTVVNSKLTLQDQDQAQDQQSLDLSIPFDIESQNSANSEHQAYLPDLFRNHKSKKNDALVIDGKIIKRDESEADKDRIVDGVGLDFKLTH